MGYAPEDRGGEMANDGLMTLRGGPPPAGRPAISLAEYIHLERKRVILMYARQLDGYKHRVAKALKISRPQLDRYIRLYGIRGHFRAYTQRASRYTPTQ